MSEVVVAQRMWQRRDTTANWTAKNPIPESGEICVELDDTAPHPVVGIKIGNGYEAWLMLPPFGGVESVTGPGVDNTDPQNPVVTDSGGSATPMQVNVQTGTSYTLVAGDAGGDVQCGNAAAITVTIPKATFAVGDWLLSSQIGDGGVTYVCAAGVAFETTGTKSTSGKGDLIGLEMIAPNVWRWIGEKVVAWLTDAPSDGTTYARKNGAWVAAGGTTGQLAGLNDQTGASYTVAASDAGKDIRCTNAGAFTLYINKQSTVPVANNFWALVSQGGAGTVTLAITAGSGVVLRTPNGAATTAIYDARGIERITGDEWRVW